MEKKNASACRNFGRYKDLLEFRMLSFGIKALKKEESRQLDKL